MVIMAVPFVLGFEPVAVIAFLALGGLVFAVTLVTHVDDEDLIPVSTHAAFDIAFIIAMAAGATAFAFVGQAAAAGLMAAASLSLVLIFSLTRWSPARA